VRSNRLAPGNLEFPRINYARNNGRPYRYVYGVGPTKDEFAGQISKIDVEAGTRIDWKEAGGFVGEPVFVASPAGAAEDDGVLLSVVLEADGKRSFLVILDAHSLKEKARAQLPHHIPFGFHGQYFRKH
jgi:beta,beta-carotene 9',10'-dioxygenase